MNSLYLCECVGGKRYIIAPYNWNGNISDIGYVLIDGEWKKDRDYEVWGWHQKKVCDLTPENRLKALVLTGCEAPV